MSYQLKRFQIPANYFPSVSVYERPDSKIRWWINYRLPDGHRKRIPISNDPTDARRVAKRKERDLAQGLFDAEDARHAVNRLVEVEPTFEEAIEWYLNSTAERKTPKTLAVERQQLEKALGVFESLGARGFADVDARMVEEFRAVTAGWRSQGLLAVTTANNCRRHVKRLTKSLAARGKIQSDPLACLDFLPAAASEQSRNVVIPAPEIESLFAVDYGSMDIRYDLKALIGFALQTGMRTGELLHLEWGDMDLERGIARVHAKPSCPTRDGLGWSPKWRKERVVPLTEEALRILRGIKSHPITSGRVGRRGDLHPARFIFPKQEGKGDEIVWTRVNISKGWSKALEAAGLAGKGYLFRDLRTTTNTLLTEHLGFTHKEASEILGNSPEVNAKHYTAVQLDLAREKMQRLPVFSKPALPLRLVSGGAGK